MAVKKEVKKSTKRKVEGTPNDKRLAYFIDEDYLMLERWWALQSQLWMARKIDHYPPSEGEFIAICIRKGIFGTLSRKGDPNIDALKELYRRMMNQPDPVIDMVLGHMGHCAPIAVYFRHGIPYLGTGPKSLGTRKVRKLRELYDIQREEDSLRIKGGTLSWQ